MQDLAVGTLAAGAADTAAAPLSTLRRLLQTGRGVQSLHLKAVELLGQTANPRKYATLMVKMLNDDDEDVPATSATTEDRPRR